MLFVGLPRCTRAALIASFCAALGCGNGNSAASAAAGSDDLGGQDDLVNGDNGGDTLAQPDLPKAADTLAKDDMVDVPPPGTDAEAVQDMASEDAVVDAQVEVDDDTDVADDTADVAAKCPGGAGCACVDSATCDSGTCLAGRDGESSCAKACQAESDCATFISGKTSLKNGTCAAYGGKKLSICVDPQVALCDPCSSNKQCQVPGSKGAVCAANKSGGLFCGTFCVDNSDCPDGYSCNETVDIDGKSANQCAPKDGGACACSPWAIQSKISGICANLNGNGLCKGEMACLPAGLPGAPTDGGLSACSAPVPATETCDGVDNNCDGATDDNVSCDDGNLCSDDKCEGDKGCTHGNNTMDCNDKNACTNGDVCGDGICKGGAVICDDKSPCTIDSCDMASGCSTVNDDKLPCSDGKVCTTDTCDSGVCLSLLLICDDKNPCTADSCDAVKGCVSANNDSAQCSDNNPCTDDTCVAAQCVSIPKAATACDDGDSCTKDSCDVAVGCVNLANGATKCDDGQACTVDKCDKIKGCSYSYLPGCSVPIPYLQAFGCADKSLQLWSPASILLPTPQGVPGEVTPVWAVDATPEDPGFKSKGCSLNFNNGSDFTCLDGGDSEVGYATLPWLDASALGPNAKLAATFFVAGGWEGGKYDILSVEVSTDGNIWEKVAEIDPPEVPWSFVSVDLSKGQGKKFQMRFKFETTDCFANNATGPFIDDLKIYDTTCKDDNDCNDGNPCTTDSCGEGSVCTFEPNVLPCDDANLCTSNDTCGDGKCMGQDKVCEDENECTDDSCDKVTGKCAFVNAVDSSFCDDGDVCTQQDGCVAGKCSGIAKCDDKNPCTKDSCDAVTAACSATATADGGLCNDGDPCTGNDACSKGICSGGPGICSNLVNDVFDCGEIGIWDIVGTSKSKWAIDASPNPPGFKSAACSLNFNNGVDYQCAQGEGSVEGVATSPEYNLAGAKSIKLTFNSYSDSETGMYDVRKFEVSTDNFATTALSVVIDAQSPQKQWAKVAIDINAFAGKKVKVRFDFSSGDCVANQAAGWFVDDLLIVTDLAKACTITNDCNDNNVCTDDACAANKCTTVFNAKVCDDNNACTSGETCAGGVCSGGKLLDCDDKEACTTDSCDPALGCKHTALADKVVCSDGNDCTTGDACKTGKCTVIQALDGAKCSDGNDCTVSDACKSGVCTAGGNATDNALCNDSDPCTLSDGCKVGVCVGSGKNACDDGNPCTADVCTKVSTFVKTCVSKSVLDGAGCDDGSPCTLGETCTANKCGNGKNVCNGFLQDDFACGEKAQFSFSPAVSGSQWKIDALPKVPGFYAGDCSLNFNNDVDYAGVVSGAATSDVFLMPAGTVEFDFWSYFGTETGASYDKCFVELSDDGFTKNIESILLVKTAANVWILEKIVFAQNWAGKNVAFRFRFNSIDNFLNSTPGWFVDNFSAQIVPALCKIDGDCKADADPCTTAKCTDSVCQQVVTVDGAGCDDGNSCTGNDVCSKGVCGGVSICDTVTLLNDPFTCGVDKGWKFGDPIGNVKWAIDGTPKVPGYLSKSCSLNFNDGVGYADLELPTSGSVTSPALLLPGNIAKASVQFQSYSGVMEFDFDKRWVDITQNGKVLATVQISNNNADDLDQWTLQTIDLLPYAGKTIQLVLHFDSTDNFANEGPGWFVDDLLVTYTGKGN